MKIFQIHRRGGEWEDYYDIIHSSYLKAEKALEEKIKLDNELEAWQKCNSCCIGANLCAPDCKASKCSKEACIQFCADYAKKNCENANITYDENDGLICINIAKDWRDTSGFYIEEVDVIE